MVRLAAQALADLLPILLCGEESAELVFAGAADDSALDATLKDLLRSVAADERGHGAALARLRAMLPPPRSRGPARRAAHFLRRLASPDLGTHLARVAALDAGVCRVLGDICLRGTLVARNPTLARVFNRIRNDEARHVRIGRQCAKALGITELERRAEQARVMAAFAELLALSSSSFEDLGVNPRRLLARIERLGR